MNAARPGEVWGRLHDGFRTQLWPTPAVGVTLAVAIGVALPRLERRTADLPPWLRDYLFSGDAGAARTVLDAVAGSLITVTALTFSLTVVTLQLASSQFSPRLLRTFTRDRVVQATLALFLGTFTYALTVLRTVRNETDQGSEFVPDISVTLAYVLAVASVVGLILFLAHLAQTIRVESMLQSVLSDALTTVRRELVERQGAPATWAALLPSGASRTLLTPSSGFLVQVSEENLTDAACRADVVLALAVRPGDSLVAGTPVGSVWSRDGSGVDDDTLEALGATLVTSFERTSWQDVGYGLRQLTDVAVKALSPGINDPTTAVHALGSSATLLCELAGRDLGPRVLRDDDDRVRAVLARPDFATLLAVGIDQPARYGAGEPAVLHRLLGLLRELAWVCAPDQQAQVEAGLHRVRDVIERGELAPYDRDELGIAAARVDHALAGRWSG